MFRVEKVKSVLENIKVFFYCALLFPAILVFLWGDLNILRAICKALDNLSFGIQFELKDIWGYFVHLFFDFNGKLVRGALSICVIASSMIMFNEEAKEEIRGYEKKVLGFFGFKKIKGKGSETGSGSVENKSLF